MHLWPVAGSTWCILPTKDRSLLCTTYCLRTHLRLLACGEYCREGRNVSNMLCRCLRITAASRRGSSVVLSTGTLRPGGALLNGAGSSLPSSSLPIRADECRSNGNSSPGSTSAVLRQPRAELSAVAAATASESLYPAPEAQRQPVAFQTPPMEEEETGPRIRELRVQMRNESESGSRGARRVRRGKYKIAGKQYLDTQGNVRTDTTARCCLPQSALFCVSLSKYESTAS